MKARKKPIEVFAVHYNHNIILEEFLKLLRTNEKSLSDMTNLMEQSTSQKNEARLHYLKVIGLSMKIIQMVVFGQSTQTSFCKHTPV